MITKSNKNVLIVCESSHNGADKKLIERLLDDHEIEFDHYEIQAKGSIDQVIRYLNTGLITSPEISSKNIDKVLVIVDADENPSKRFKEIQDCFDKDFFSVQSEMTSSISHPSEKVDVGIFLFPDNHNPGSLETLCIKALKGPCRDKKIPCVEKYFKCLEDNDIDTLMTENNISKSKFRIMMATPNPDRYIDSIINCIDTDSPPFRKILDFLKHSQ